MPKCKKVKNACKICLAPVKQRNGLKCQGACACWIHYRCLNYTPGKIKDIKAGIIKVNCPCPDCKSSMPKESRADEPFSCTNMECPANNPPTCGNARCPINVAAPNKMNQTSIFNLYGACQLGACGKSCKDSSRTKGREPPVSLMVVPYPPQRTPDPCLGVPRCPSQCSSSDKVSGDNAKRVVGGLPSVGALEQMCTTVGQLTEQINGLMNEMRQVVQERTAAGGGGGGGGGGGPGGGTQEISAKVSPKSCYCPGNPSKKK